MFILQVDFEFLRTPLETKEDVEKWVDIIASKGANLITVWFQPDPQKQASTIVKELCFSTV